LGQPVVERDSIWSIYCALLGLVKQYEGIQSVLDTLQDLPDHPEDDLDGELSLILGLADLREVEGYMGGVGNGLGLRKCYCQPSDLFSHYFQSRSIWMHLMHSIVKTSPILLLMLHQTYGLMVSHRTKSRMKWMKLRATYELHSTIHLGLHTSRGQFRNTRLMFLHVQLYMGGRYSESHPDVYQI